MTTQNDAPGVKCLQLQDSDGAVFYIPLWRPGTDLPLAVYDPTNKPGDGPNVPVRWLPVKCNDGSTYHVPFWQ
jgi:hypothetical protein